MKKLAGAGAGGRGQGNGAGIGSHRNGFERLGEILPLPLCSHALVESFLVNNDRLFLYSDEEFVVSCLLLASASQYTSAVCN